MTAAKERVKLRHARPNRQTDSVTESLGGVRGESPTQLCRLRTRERSTDTQVLILSSVCNTG